MDDEGSFVGAKEDMEGKELLGTRVDEREGSFVGKEGFEVRKGLGICDMKVVVGSVEGKLEGKVVGLWVMQHAAAVIHTKL